MAEKVCDLHRMDKVAKRVICITVNFADISEAVNSPDTQSLSILSNASLCS